MPGRGCPPRCGGRGRSTSARARPSARRLRHCVDVEARPQPVGPHERLLQTGAAVLTVALVSPTMRHAILGAGGIGGLVGAALARDGGDVALVMRPDTLARYSGRLAVESAVLGDFEVDIPA